jgi:hypothetical protein
MSAHKTKVPAAPSLFKKTLDECRDLYVAAGRLCAHEYPHLISPQGDATSLSS